MRPILIRLPDHIARRAFVVLVCLAALLPACSSATDRVDINEVVGHWESASVSVEMLGFIKYQMLLERDGKAHVRVLSGDGQVRLEADGEYVIDRGSLTFMGSIADHLSSEPHGISMPSPDVLVLHNDGEIEFSRMK